MKIKIIIFLNLIVMPVFSQSNNVIHYSYYGYTKFGNNENLISIAGMGSKVFFQNFIYEIEGLPFSWTTRDPFNNYKSNLAFPSTFIFVMLATIYDQWEYLHGPYSLLLLPASILSGKYHIFTKNLNSDSFYQWPNGISLFFKHDINIFPFRENAYLLFSPGIGLSFFTTKTYVFSRLQIGYNQNIYTNFSKNYKSEYIFFTITFMGRND